MSLPLNMASSLLLVATLAAAFLLPAAEARINATGAIQVFLISDCDVCTADKNSIFCSEAVGADADNFVSNGTMKVTIGDKKAMPDMGAAKGAKFCWSGTFGKMLSCDGNYTDLLGSPSVLVQLKCDDKNLFYRQCIIPLQMTEILMAVGGFVFVTATTLICFCCGCCKCCNEKGDTSKWGCCNRFCPWCTLCADKHLREKEYNADSISEERSLTGKSSKLNDAYKGTEDIVNPMRAKQDVI